MSAAPRQERFDGDVTTSRAILRALPAHVALLAEDGAILDVNDAWVQFAADNGLPGDAEAVRANYLEVCDRSASSGCEEAGRVARGIRDLLAGRAPAFSLEYPCHSPTQERWFQLTARRADSAHALLAVVMHVDVTDRKKTEEALAEQSMLLRHAQRIAELGYWSVDVATKRLYLSEEAVRILALPKAAAEGPARRLLRRFLRDDFPLLRDNLEPLGHADGSADFQARVHRSDGAVRWLRLRVESGGRGNIRRISGTLVDITERRAAGEALRESEARARRTAAQFERTLDLSLDVICTVDETGRFQQVSAACERLWGYQPNDLVGTLAMALIVPDDRKRSEKAATRARHGMPVASFKNRVCRADGSVAHVSWSLRWSPEDRVSYCVVRDESATYLLEEAHRHREQFLQTTLDTVTDALLVLDRQLRLTYINREAERLMRQSRELLLGQPLDQVFKDVIEVRQRYLAAMEDQQPCAFEFYYAPYDIWVGIRAFPTPDRLAVYFRDISDERRLRQALLASEERFKLIARVTADAVWDWDVEKDTLWWGDGLHSLFGLEAHGDRPGLGNWGSRIHPDEKDGVLASLSEVLRGNGNTWSAHYRFRRSDGRYAMAHDRAFVLRNEEGLAVRMVGGMSDVTAQREIEQQLREQAHLLDAARDAIHVLDIGHRVRYWNRSAENLYGWGADEVYGATVELILRPEEAQLRAATRLLVENGAWSGELERTTRDGRRLMVDSRWTLMLDEHGAPARILVIDTDNTERKHLESQVLRTQRLDSIGTLAGGVAHDLNNVFTPILVSANLLAASQAAGSAEAKLVDAIAGSAQRGADMVSQLLLFARGVEGRPSVIHPDRALSEVRRLAADSFPKNIRVEIECDPGAWFLEADATQLHQILLNLAVNARDAMPEGGLLTLRAYNLTLDAPAAAAIPESREGSYVVFEVIDTGTGIARDVVDKIFDPFFTTKERGKGTGLGLSTSRAIVNAHRGFIQVFTEPGKGTSFRVALPASLEAAGSTLEVAAEDRAQPGHGQGVLVVDDEPAIRRIVATVLQSSGYVVHLAVDGADAIAIFARERQSIHVVLMDMMMPVMDGAAAIQVLRRMAPDLPVVATSGFATDAQMAKVRESGVELVMSKPFTKRVLLDTVGRALASSQDPAGKPTSLAKG